VLACARHFQLIPGVRRAALATVYPTRSVRGAKEDPFSLILDVGATVEATAEDLVTFAVMGSAYARIVSKNERPKVALLSNGTEPERGREEVVAAHAALAGAPALNFVGNREGFAIGTGEMDVLVADGFTGNVALKVMEGTSAALLAAVRSAATGSFRATAGGLLLRPALRGLRDEIDPESQGGAFLLGLRRLGVAAHGSFGARGWARAIELAARGVREDVGGRTHARLEAAGALRRSREPSAPADTVPAEQ
jgi:glycerol-3-phosphate acyltransferase PlsX